MKLKVNPTRMELLKLRRRVRLAMRGHKLLKDKEEQLLIEFRTLVEDVKESRKSVEKELSFFYPQVLKLKGLQDEKSWKTNIGGNSMQNSFTVENRRVYNIPVSEIHLHSTPGKLASAYTATPFYNHLLQTGRETLEHLLKLSFLENKLISFAAEIERTRRRVNALEYVLIPNLQETIKFISFKLNEAERSSLVMLKHIQLTRQQNPFPAHMPPRPAEERMS